jgi:hypothetical protein
MKVGPAGGGLITMRCIGQSVGSETELRNQLKTLTTLETPSSALSRVDVSVVFRHLQCAMQLRIVLALRSDRSSVTFDR